MAKRKRIINPKPKPKPKQRNHKRANKKYETRRETGTSNNPQSNTAEQSDTEKENQKPKGEWVKFEHRDADGNPTLPKKLIEGTSLRRFEDIPEGTEISALVLAGYKPKPLLMVERKIYEIHRLSTRGWRRSGQILIEVDGWRQHEGEWFNGMQGIRLEILDPGFTGPHNEKSHYVVSGSAFDKKIVHLHNRLGNETESKIYEGTLDITETWKSAWQRHAAEVLNLGFKYFLLPVICAVLSGLAVWWINSQPAVGTQNSVSEGSKINQNVEDTQNDSPTKIMQKDTTQNSVKSVIPSKHVNERLSLDSSVINEPDAKQSQQFQMARGQ